MERQRKFSNMMTFQKIAMHRNQREVFPLNNWFQQCYTFLAFVNIVTNDCFNSCYLLVVTYGPILQSIALCQMRATLPRKKLIKETLTMIQFLL